jgi:hypothetical protein
VCLCVCVCPQIFIKKLIRSPCCLCLCVCAPKFLLRSLWDHLVLCGPPQFFRFLCGPCHIEWKIGDYFFSELLVLYFRIVHTLLCLRVSYLIIKNNTERASIAMNLYSRGARFEYRLGYWLPWLMLLMVLLSSSKEILEQYLNWVTTDVFQIVCNS